MRKFIKSYFIIIAFLMPLLSKSQVPKDPEIDSLRFNRTRSSNVKDYNPKVILPTPQSQAFSKYINHEVNEYHGLPQIEIPLGEISLKGLTIPIVLSYHASGIKYMQADGELGAGWSINIGGYRVSRTIYGKSDFNYTNRFNSYEFNFPYTQFYKENYLARAIQYVPENSTGAITALGQDFSLDGEYDIFSFNIPKSNGNFILQGYKKEGKNKGCIFGCTNEDISIYDETSITIKDDNGNKLFFGKKDCVEKVLQDYEIHPVGWPLINIETYLGDKLNFSYKKYDQYMSRFSGDYGVTINNAASEMIFGECLLDPSFSRGKSLESSARGFESTSETYYIDKIEGDNISIYFDRKDVDAKYKNTPCFIKGISIKNSNGTIIKKINFNYNSEAQYVENHRLLKSVEISDGSKNVESYNFKYNESSFGFPDQWGYYSGIVSEKSGDIILHEEFGSDDVVSFTSIGQSMITPEIVESVSTDKFSEFYPGYINLSNRINSYSSPCFTLEKITYPTGGYTEYTYEPHVTDKYIGGGIRVKSIKSTASSNDKPLVTNYEYSNGIPSFDVDHTNFRNSKINFSWGQNCPACLPESMFIQYKSVIYTEKVMYSMFPLDDLPMHDFSIMYEKVTKTDVSDGISTGKTVSTYKIPKRYKTQKMNISDVRKPFLRKDISIDKTVISDYVLGLKPQLSEVRIYNNVNTLLFKEEIRYKVSNRYGGGDLYEIKGLKVNKKIDMGGNYGGIGYDLSNATKEGFERPNKLNWIPYCNTICPGEGDKEGNIYNYVSSLFNYKIYSLRFGRFLPEKKITTYYNQGPIEIKEIYKYDDKLRLKSIIKTNSEGNYVEKTYSYPLASSTLEKANILTKPINTQLFNVKIDTTELEVFPFNTLSINDGFYPVDVEDFYKLEYHRQPAGFEETTYPTNSIFPTGIKTSTSTSENSRIVLTYDKYDAKGNILQYTGIDGIPVSYIWSYNYQYPIAEFRNMTYADAETLVMRHLGVSSAEALAKSKSPNEAKIKTLATSQSNDLALITTYTYKPMVGILTTTDPRGVLTGYEYDSFNRLRRIYMVESGKEKTLETYEYNQVNK